MNWYQLTSSDWVDLDKITHIKILDHRVDLYFVGGGGFSIEKGKGVTEEFFDGLVKLLGKELGVMRMVEGEKEQSKTT